MKVALMVTCVNDAMFPDTGKAVVALLRRLGVDVEFPLAQTCCGQPMVNTGYLDEAVPVVRNFVSAFEGYDAVVAPSGSCAGSVRHQHGLVARRSGDPGLVAAAAEISPRTYELSEFLVDVLGVTDVGAYFPHRVTYHPTCHSLRMLGVGDRPLQLLRAVRGLSLVALPRAEECCGFGGTFAVKNADTSVSMGSDKARHVGETGAEVLVAGDNSCLMHIGGVLSRQQAGVRVMHLAEVLASTSDSTGGGPGRRLPGTAAAIQPRSFLARPPGPSTAAAVPGVRPPGSTPGSTPGPASGPAPGPSTAAAAPGARPPGPAPGLASDPDDGTVR